MKRTLMVLAIGLIAITVNAEQPLLSRLAIATVAVADYDEAIDWYTQKLGLIKKHDATFGGERFVTVAASDQSDFEIALAKPGMTPEEQEAGKTAVGKGGTMVFHTTDCRHAYEVMRERGVVFKETPRNLPWGVQAIAVDLYGNQIVILEPRTAPRKTQ